MKPAALDKLPWRVTGMLLLAVLVVAYQPEREDLWHRLVIPAGMALAAWMLVQNLLAVAIGAGVLAAVHSAPASGDWVTGLAYPIFAALCALVVAVGFGARFRRHIHDTHDARWRHRRAGGDGGRRRGV